ncbi:response regulator [uncultured Gimesia sp.]|uniref:response regulator n=1 Tax=uncultured Gimesia sp. TaxID=1678688 RepID=UPI0030D9CD3A
MKESVQTPPGKNEVILLIDDEAMLAHTTRDILASLGYQVITSTTPREAIQAAQNYQGTIDLLISDVVMPEMNGRDLYHTLKIIRPELKVLYISGYTVNIIADHGVVKDGIPFLRKPFSRHQLAVKARQVIEQDEPSESAQ